MPAVSVILPVRRDSGSFKSAVERVRTSMAAAGVECEIVAVIADDAAAGDSTAEADRAVEHQGRAGLGALLKTGIVAANHELIAVVDPESGYAVERLPELVRLAERHATVVGARTGARGQVVRRLCEFATGSSIPDHDSAMRVFRRSEILPLLASLDDGAAFGTTATLAYLFDGRSVAHVPIEASPAVGNRRNAPVDESLVAFQSVFETILKRAPLRLFLLLAALLAILGVPATGFGFLVAVTARLFDWYLSTTLLGCAIFLAGIGAVLASALTLGMGMLAESLISRRTAGIGEVSPTRRETAAV